VALSLTFGMSISLDLSGSAWRPSYISASALPSKARMFVQFKPDGLITGNGGCNRFFGPYSISGNTIKIGPLASTRKGCPGLIQVETAFFATLEAATTFERDETKLVLFNEAGVEVAAFTLAD
jgi:heat shock protein HslJ